MIHTLLLKAFTISKLKFRNKLFLIIAGLFVFWTANLYCQQSLDYFGNSNSRLNSNFRLNSLEGNVSNFNLSKDMELSATFYGAIDSKINSNLYSISFLKKIGLHSFYVRYTPGIIQQFIIRSGMNVQLPDSIAELKTKLNYEEKFGLGYSIKLSSYFTFGLSLRYFAQEFSEDKPVLFYTDTVNYISLKNEVTKSNFWRGDIGFTYLPSNNFSASIFSYNLFLSEETEKNDLTNNYSVKKEKGISALISFYPFERMNILAGYESSSSFYGGLNFSAKIFNGSLTFGGVIFHDKYQNPYFAGIIPSINYSTNLFSITLSGIKYFSNRLSSKPLSTMINNGIHSITNNIYSYDKAFLSVNFALSFVKEKQVRFLDVEVKEEIYPTLGDIYLQKPFAIGKAINLTDKKIEVRPSSFIKNINEEIIFSPTVNIPPFDTVEIPFYTIVGKSVLINKREISQVDFYLSIDDLEPDDKIQRPILINDANSWDGNVSNLIYFVRNDFEFSSKYSKSILQKYKEQLDTIDQKLSVFNKIKILFENFVKGMNYVADPRASVEHVQFPNETIKLKGGDCDDLSVCFASMLESIGIQTAFVDYKNPDGISHVNLIINTNLSPSQMNLITRNDSKVIIRKNTNGDDEIWIPIETTSLTDFNTAWSIAAEKFNEEAIDEYGLSTGKVVIVDIY